MTSPRQLLDRFSADPVDLIAHLLPGGAVLVGLFGQLPNVAARLPEQWEQHPVWLVLAVAGAWVLGLLMAQLSHVLNRPYNLWAARRRSRQADVKRDRVRYLAGDMLGPDDSAYAFARQVLSAPEHEALLALATRLEAISKLFRTLCLLALLSLVWAGISAQAFAVLGGLGGVTFLCWRIFIEHRWAASQAMYQGYLMVQGQIKA